MEFDLSDPVGGHVWFKLMFGRTAGAGVSFIVVQSGFYINLVLFLALGFWFMFTPRSWSMAALKTWASASLWWMKLITGTTMEVRGREHIPQSGGLLAGKHQSAWDIFALLPLLADPALVLKRELTFIPVFGWFCLKFKMISVQACRRRWTS